MGGVLSLYKASGIFLYDFLTMMSHKVSFLGFTLQTCNFIAFIVNENEQTCSTLEQTTEGQIIQFMFTSQSCLHIFKNFSNKQSSIKAFCD